MAFVLVARREVCGVRSAEPERNAETLRISHGNISAEFARSFQQCESKDVRRDDNECACVMCLHDEVGIIVDRAISGGILDECAKNALVEFETRVIPDLYLDSEWLRPRLDDGDRLWMTIIGNEERFPIWSDRMTERHCFGGSRGFVQKRRVCDIERSQIDDHLLEIEQRLEPALGDFCLIRSVSCVPTGIFEDITLYHGRCNAVVVPRADKRADEFVLAGDGPQLPECFGLRFRLRQVQLAIQPDAFW